MRYKATKEVIMDNQTRRRLKRNTRMRRKRENIRTMYWMILAVILTVCIF